jgi:hypothetical protein
MFDIVSYAQKYLEEPVSSEVDAKLSDLFKKKAPTPAPAPEPEPLVKGEVQPQLTDESVDKSIRGMKGLSNFLFSIGVKPHTWAMLSPAEKKNVSETLFPKPVGRGSFDLTGGVIYLDYPRYGIEGQKRLESFVNKLLSKLSGFPEFKSDVEEYMSKFLKDPNKTKPENKPGELGYHTSVRDYPPTGKEMPKLASEELIASDVALIEMSLQEVEAADREINAAWETIEAARKRKKKWVQNINLKKGRLTKYKRPGESMEDAANRALNSDDPSVRGMGSFFMAAHKFKHKKGKGA